MKVQLLSTRKSNSLRRVADALTKALGYKVWRTAAKRHDRKQFLYGDLVDKLQQYKFFQQKGLNGLEFTQDAKVAAEWQKKGTVVGRKTLTGSSGAGIVLFEPGEQAAHGCLAYTKYVPKKREFRVHVFKDKVVTIVEKRLKKDWDGPHNPKIRNLANGYIFCQELDLTQDLRQRINVLALAASKVCGSDFRGVDLGYNEKNDNLFIIEVNSAPGIEGSNVGKYVEVIKTYV